MARVQYKGFDLPDGVETPDVPADLRKLVDGGPIPRFATTAARDAALTAVPPVGTVCYLASNGELQVFYGGATGWRKPWSQPWGILGRAFRNTAMSLTSIETEATRTNTFTVPANRYMRFTAQAGTYNGYGGNNGIGFGIHVNVIGSRITSFSPGASAPAGQYGDSSVGSCMCVQTLAAGTYAALLGSSSVFAANLMHPMHVVVEDIGPTIGGMPV